MALIVETGTGRPDAESYAGVAEADARCAAFGVADWAALTDGDKEIALRDATRFMVANYRARWAGGRVYQHQALDWPRYNVCVDGWTLPSNAVPVDVVNACIDLAARAGQGAELLPDLDTGSNAVKRDKTGPLETEYFENTTSASDRFVAVDAALAPYFGAGNGGNTLRVLRA